MATEKPPIDPVVDRYILQFQQRHRRFLQDRKAELKEIGLDSFSQIYQEYFVFPSKQAYDAILQAILEPTERDLLQIDPQFTKAWNIFVDLCWLHKKTTRAGIVIFATVICLGIAVVIFWQSPQLGGKVVMAILGGALVVWALPQWLKRQ